MGMQFVKCENCQCWNQDHWVYDNEKLTLGKEKNCLFGICQRHAPTVFAVNTNSPSRSYYLKIPFSKRTFPIGIYQFSVSQRVLPSMRYDEGCWEGIPKDE